MRYFHPATIGNLNIPPGELLLDRNVTLGRLHHTLKFREKVIPLCVNHSAPILHDTIGKHFIVSEWVK
jgi:hypothetical protein